MLALVGAASLVVVVIQGGKEPVVAHEPEVHARIAGFDIGAFASREGKVSVTVAVEPTVALYVTPVPLSQG